MVSKVSEPANKSGTCAWMSFFIPIIDCIVKAKAVERAQALLADHRRVREAARDVGQYSVSPCLPVDVIGVYVLLPDAL